MLRAQPKLERDTARIQFLKLGESSLDVEVFAYILEKEVVLLRIMEIIADSGTRLAIPSQNTYLHPNILRGGSIDQVDGSLERSLQGLYIVAHGPLRKRYE